MTQTTTADSSSIKAEAQDWLLWLDDINCAPYKDVAGRNAAFWAWVLQSPNHLREFLAYLKIETQLYNLSPATKARIPTEPSQRGRFRRKQRS